MWKACFFVGAAVLVFGFLSPVFGQSDHDQGQLTLHITGFEHDDGVAKVALVNSKKNYTAPMPYKGFNLKIVNLSAQKTVAVPYGEYALKVYHDENENDQLDKHMLGMPIEPYGFSNNARGRFGAPKYEAVKFVVDSPVKDITITLN